MQPELAPVEAVETAGLHQLARADAEVMQAWGDHHGEIYAFLVRMVRDEELAAHGIRAAGLKTDEDCAALGMTVRVRN